jgi:Phosphotransferase enzyme family
VKHVAAGRVPSPQVETSARSALAAVGLSPKGPLVSLPTPMLRPSRQVVYSNVGGSGRWSEVAVRVAVAPDTAAVDELVWEQQVARVLSGIAERLHADRVIGRNPVAGPVHDRPIQVGADLATVWEFVPASGARLTAAGWGEMIGLLHVIGSAPEALTLLAQPPGTGTLADLDADVLLAHLDEPSHPFHGRRRLVQRWARTLQDRAEQAHRLDPHPLLIHRDLHPMNCIPTVARGVIAIDWQEAGWGSRSDDFAWMHLLVRRFGGDPRTLDAARQAYAAVTGSCPSVEQITAAGHVRELVFLGYSIQNAHRSAEHLAECLTELPVLAGPNARTGRWRLLFNPDALAPELVA